ncbi:MAG: hypothetical protein R6V58_13800, partial [Planctomycetota bacterium]
MSQETGRAGGKRLNVRQLILTTLLAASVIVLAIALWQRRPWASPREDLSIHKAAAKGDDLPVDATLPRADFYARQALVYENLGAPEEALAA